MKKILLFISAVCIVFLASCEGNVREKIDSKKTEIQISDKKDEKLMYICITAEQAKNIIDSDEEYVILDVREQHEYDEGHIPGAILIPYTQIEKLAPEKLPDKQMQILVYCRSGRRSKIASESLVQMGYTGVKEFGGIIDWPYEIEK